ncbi:MAG: multicopper oxidase domain-containing protein [Vulcanimicrobiaceae bacterium]
MRLAAAVAIATGAWWATAAHGAPLSLTEALAHRGAWCGLAAAAAQASPPAGGLPPRYPGRAQRVGGLLHDPPAVIPHGTVTRLELDAVSTTTAQHLFAYAGRTIAPAIHVVAGGSLLLTYVDDLPSTSRQQCSIGPCTNVTNMHFHGYGGSPNAPADDVLTMLARPGGTTLHYDVPFPPEQPPGLYWYHTHPHTESENQVLDGMAGAMVVDGIERYVPEIRGLRSHLLVVRAIPVVLGDAVDRGYLRDTETPLQGCGITPTSPPDRAFTVDDAIRPTIAGAPGERQFWRIVNASADHFADLRYTGGAFEIVALDGYPLVWRDPAHRTRLVDHVELPPATRVEAIVTLPPAGRRAELRSKCFITGPAGDPNPAAVLADVTTSGRAWTPPRSTDFVAISPPLPAAFAQIPLVESSPPAFVAVLTEDDHGFYINGQKFAMDAPPMAQVQVDCHLLNHEDKGMMAKVLFK